EFLGLGICGELLLARSLPPDDRAIQLELSGGQTLFFDPAELSARRLSHGGEHWLELSSSTGLTVMLGVAAVEREGASAQAGTGWPPPRSAAAPASAAAISSVSSGRSSSAAFAFARPWPSRSEPKAKWEPERVTTASRTARSSRQPSREIPRPNSI